MNAQSHTPACRRLSVAMIVRDEQNVLAATIESILSIADEVVVVDTGSTDQTRCLAEQLGAKVVHESWKDDFGAARNRMLAEARGDWILWLNAGEHLSVDSARQLRRFIDVEANASHAYAVMVQLPSVDPSASAEQSAQPRLLPANAGLRFVGRVRETLAPSLLAAGLQMAIAPGVIVRHAREHDSRRKAVKAQRNLRLIDFETRQGPDLSVRTLLASGEAYGDLGQQEAARQAFSRACQLAPRGSTEMLEAYYGLLTTLDGEASQRNRQLAICLEALEIYPLDAQLLCAMGSYLQARNQLDLAARAFRIAMEHGQVNLEIWHLADISEMSVICLGLTLQLQGKDDEARQVFEGALSRCQHSVRIRRHLLNLDVKHGRQAEALMLVDGMPLDHQRREAFRQAALGAIRASKKDWTAALGYLQSAYTAGCHDPFCLRWLSVALLSNAQVAAAAPVLRHWQQLEPANTELAAYLKAIADGPRAAAGESTAAQPFRQLRFDSPTLPLDLPSSESQSVRLGQPSPDPNR